jgi:hypothetical protein
MEHELEIKDVNLFLTVKMKESAWLVRLQPKLQKKKVNFYPYLKLRLYCKGGTDDAHFEIRLHNLREFCRWECH